MRTRQDGDEYSPLHPPMTAEVDGELFRRLNCEWWDCIVIGYDDIRDKEGALPSVMVCEWTGERARRIGIVNLSMSVLRNPNRLLEMVHFPKTWRTGIQLE